MSLKPEELDPDSPVPSIETPQLLGYVSRATKQTKSAPQSDAQAKTQDPTRISIKLVDQNKYELCITLPKTVKMAKLMQLYCQRSGRDLDHLRFILDGNRIMEDDTPQSLQMEDGDVVDVVQEQVGGE